MNLKRHDCAVTPYWRHLWIVVALLIGNHLITPARNVTQASPPRGYYRQSHQKDNAAIRALSRAEDLELDSQWGEALNCYQQGQKAWPNRIEFRKGRQRCETHLDRVRRYQNHSFRESVRSLTSQRAFALCKEVLQTIQSYYVDRVNMKSMIDQASDHFSLALNDPGFIRANASNATPVQIHHLRSQLSNLKRHPIVTVHDAQTVVRHVSQNAYDTIRMKTAPVVMEYIISICSSLDIHSGYLTSAALNDLYAQIDGNFVGIGVEVKADDIGLRVLSVLPGSPAFEQGVRGGDHITYVDHTALAGMSTGEASSRLKGSQGTRVEIRILSAMQQYERTVILRRKNILIKSISEARVLDRGHGIAYIKLVGFQKSTVSELETTLWRLHRQGMQSLILDLRGNPGGLLTSAVDVSDRFINRGQIVSTRGRAPGQSLSYSAGRPTRTWHMPMVLMIDNDSASASEIVAACLSDHNRATLVGQTSYGKGEVQSIYPLATIGAGLRLTTARFFSPNGRALSKRGVTPHVTVSQRNTSSRARFHHKEPADIQLQEALSVARDQLVRR